MVWDACLFVFSSKVDAYVGIRDIPIYEFCDKHRGNKTSNTRVWSM